MLTYIFTYIYIFVPTELLCNFIAYNTMAQLFLFVFDVFLVIIKFKIWWLYQSSTVVEHNYYRYMTTQ